ncbi:hypothetical protein KDA_06270 [Dictyobacter alpinus]|uniref:Uncharacterized protein n=1 Tax=Dictyobacter alpinus TaxID=2014873 RepID=A0A402B1D5_9CHLR|nr:PfkB family carbohydrate kinase [Dictyobacter alpinus]GCE25143.1 hypothetical protein KDA_06270 [Dictyobacter alpinus]
MEEITTPQALTNLIRTLSAAGAEVSSKKVIVGFDGFVDEIIRPIRSREASGPTYFSTITQFSSFTADAAGKSADIEIEAQEVRFGGNAPLMANGLARLGMECVCIGTLGYPSINPAFEQMAPGCCRISFADPGTCHAFEFHDGKLMFARLDSLAQDLWQQLCVRVDPARLREEYQEADLIAFADWSNLTQATTLWRNVKVHYLDTLPEDRKKQLRVFFDLADPSRRSTDDLAALAHLLNEFAQTYDSTLGLNEHEARTLYAAWGLKTHPQHGGETLVDIGRSLRQHCQVTRLVIHPIDQSLVITEGSILHKTGKKIAEPCISTGGGDHYNAGFCYGLLAGYPLEECLVLAMAVSACYVSSGRTPDRSEVLTFLHEWLQQERQRGQTSSNNHY